MSGQGPIGIFDSGYGGLTVMREIVSLLPKYDYLYLGDNARAPYGNRSFETVYHYTLEAVMWFFERGCPLVILACNTASAKALRTIQQRDLPRMEDPSRRVLGVIRPTAEVIGDYTRSGSIGVLGTRGTVDSESYVMEIRKFHPNLRVFQQACPMWVPLVENREHWGPGADFFVKDCLDRLFSQAPEIDTLLLACTHFPLLMEKIERYLPHRVRAVSQGDIVARSLVDYIARHPEIETRITQGSPVGARRFHTTDDTGIFDSQAGLFYGSPVYSEEANLSGKP
jgi:glutamate racemase